MITAKEARRRLNEVIKARQQCLDEIEAEIESAIEHGCNHIYWAGLQDMPDIQDKLCDLGYKIMIDDSGAYIFW